tara:strand:- start:5737 stop:6420 length:684 start_codon:yes stop_codon:yes gene_type:complete
MALNDNIVNQMAGLHRTVGNLGERNLSDTDRGVLYQNGSFLAGNLSGANPLAVLKNIGTKNPGIAYRTLDDYADSIATNLRADYDDNNDTRKQYATAFLNDQIEHATTIAEAARILEYAFLPVLDIQRPNQEEANTIEWTNLANAGMPSYAITENGNPNDIFQARYRQAISQYVTPITDAAGNTTGHSINDDAFSGATDAAGNYVPGLMDDVRLGCVMEHAIKNHTP